MARTVNSIAALRDDGPITGGRVIALLGAESTGKTQLAGELAQALSHRSGWRCTWVPEWLRSWCVERGRTPHRHEQQAIAEEQSRRIEEARLTHDVVVADTTALMTAVYSRLLFGDDSLNDWALRLHTRYDLTLVTQNDLAWQADGHLRDGPQVREPVHRALIGLLQAGSIEPRIIRGQGTARLACALDHVQRAWSREWAAATTAPNSTKAADPGPG